MPTRGKRQEARCKVIWAMGGETGDGETCVRCRSTVDVPRQVRVVRLG